MSYSAATPNTTAPTTAPIATPTRPAPSGLFSLAGMEPPRLPPVGLAVLVLAALASLEGVLSDGLEGGEAEPLPVVPESGG